MLRMKPSMMPSCVLNRIQNPVIAVRSRSAADPVTVDTPSAMRAATPSPRMSVPGSMTVVARIVGRIMPRKAPPIHNQYWLWMGGAFLGMFLPTILATTVIEPGTDIRGLGVAARIADGVSTVTGSAALRLLTAMTGFWILFSTQLGIMDGFIRNITDTLWTGSPAVRRWRGGDVRAVYYTVWSLLLVWGCIAINLAQPIVLIQLGAAMASLIFVFVAIHTFVVNRRFLPPELRPPAWRQAALWASAVFFGIFAGFWLYRNFVA